VQAFLEEEIEVLVEDHLAGDDPESWNLDALAAALAAMGLTGEGTTADELWELGSRGAISEHLLDLTDARLAAREQEVGEADWAQVERVVLVRTIDSLWVEHLTELDDMRRGIGLRGYAQQDPLNEFRREAFRLYEELRGLIRHGVASSIFRVTVQRQPAPGSVQPLPGPGQPARPAATSAATSGNGAGSAPAAAASMPVEGAAILRGAVPSGPAVRNVRESVGDTPVATPAGSAVGAGAASSPSGPKPGYTPSGARIGRNDPCYCGSGAKYKKCHGR
jgi:preprotein translocase subunit SecA